MADGSKLTCVTGASGFIGTHVVRELLTRGYTVRGTVRDASDERKTAHLRAIAEELGAADRLELHSADLLVDGAFDDIIAGCSSVYHVASAVFLTAKDPQREIVDPALKGTRSVFTSIVKAGTVTGVGLTSSIAAILSSAPRTSHTYTEADWADDAGLDNNPYGLAKRLAEKAAWEVRDSLPEAERWDLVVVNPVLVTGPVYAKVHLRSSTSVVRDVMRGSFKGCPALAFGLVDVRDVTEALIGGVEAGGKTGRYILHTESLWMKDLATTIAAAHPELKVPTRSLPNFVLYIAALFDKRLTWGFLRRNLGVMNKIDHSKVLAELLPTLRDARTSVLDTARSMLGAGFVKPR